MRLFTCLALWSCASCLGILLSSANGGDDAWWSWWWWWCLDLTPRPRCWQHTVSRPLHCPLSSITWPPDTKSSVIIYRPDTWPCNLHMMMLSHWPRHAPVPALASLPRPRWTRGLRTELSSWARLLGAGLEWPEARLRGTRTSSGDTLDKGKSEIDSVLFSFGI